MSLMALKVRNARPGRHADQHGLYLIVRLSGSRSWILGMQFKGRRRDFGLGPVHDVSLLDARCLASELRRMVRAGLDPVKERDLRQANVPIFEMEARRCYEAMRGGRIVATYHGSSASRITSFPRSALSASTRSTARPY